MIIKDSLAAFLASDKIIKDADASTRILTQLLGAYSRWCHEQGHRTPTENGVKRALVDLGIEIRNVHGKAMAQGIKLSPKALLPSEPDLDLSTIQAS